MQKMNILKIFTLSLLFGSCCGETELPKNGLNGDIKFITEFTIDNKKDLLNNIIRDTLFVNKKAYNKRNQIIKWNQKMVFLDDSMDITYHYNRCNRLMKERVKLVSDSLTFDVDYFYKNSLPVNFFSEIIKDSMIHRHTGINQYDSNNRLTESILTHISLDRNTGDTITNQLQIEKYDDDVLKESEFKFHNNLVKNYRSEYTYEEKFLKYIKKYNNSDSLISTTRFEYRFDKLGNWIERKNFENDELNTLYSRVIEYK